jgi:soluble lytic murein transglycosylase-like protein
MIDRNGEWIRHTTSRLRIGAGLTLGLLVVVGTLYAGAPIPGSAGEAAPATVRPGGAVGAAAGPAGVPALPELSARVERVRSGWAELARYYESEVAPIERVLRRYHGDERLTGRVASALVREARAAGLEPRLLLAVLLVENPWLDPTIRSSVGAVGLMQVMPVHRGGWSCGHELEDIDTNVCLGARVFAHYLDRTGGDLEKALLRYNGCVTGSNTPNCHQYPSQVFARAGRASVLAWYGQTSPAGSP